jgi:hypothetical protein
MSDGDFTSIGLWGIGLDSGADPPPSFRARVRIRVDTDEEP